MSTPIHYNPSPMAVKKVIERIPKEGLVDIFSFVIRRMVQTGAVNENKLNEMFKQSILKAKGKLLADVATKKS